MISESHEKPRKVKRKVQIVVFTRTPETRVLILRRPPDRGSIWQPVTGNVDSRDLSLVEAARRELSEETGITQVRAIRDTGVDFHFRKGDADVVERLIAVETPGIMDVVISDEHVAAAWLPADAALDRMEWETNREGVRRVLTDPTDRRPR
jgi:8-oxo-dGTP pyrophosphatase MutT (NUDIX family)